MEFVEHENDRPESISIARCRELLGEEAESMTDQEVALIRRHAETMACIVIEMHQERCRNTDRSRASETPLVRAREWIYAATMVGAVIYVRVSTK
jgi:hypothetical protein